MTDSQTKQAPSSQEEPKANATQWPWVTWLALGACGVIFLGLAAQDDNESWEAVSKFGYINAYSIREGSIWGLVTAAFVHIELWHIAFNAYWLLRLGSALERTIGRWRYILFYILAAFVSSTAQLALTDDTGIGASGALYGFFGFMWFTRDRYPLFAEVLDDRTVRLFVVWLGACVLLTQLGILSIANGAHIGGVVFGVSVAVSMVLRFKPYWSFSALALLLGLSVLSIFWAPWTPSWLSQKALTAEIDGRADEALELYGKFIELRPNEPWGYLRRMSIYSGRDELEAAKADYRRARELDPTLEEWK